MDNYTACNNLQDIRPLVEKDEINNLVTYDILYEYYKKEEKTIEDIDKIITDMKSKKRNLPNTPFEEYIDIREKDIEMQERDLLEKS